MNRIFFLLLLVGRLCCTRLKYMQFNFLLLFIKGSFVITTSGLKCYQCDYERGDKCDDKFSTNGAGVREVNSTSGYCWVRAYIILIFLYYTYLLFRN